MRIVKLDEFLEPACVLRGDQKNGSRHVLVIVQIQSHMVICRPRATFLTEVIGMTDTRLQLSTSWIVVLINMIFADVFSIMVAIQNNSTFPISGDVEIYMAIAAVLTNIPILMIYLSKILPHKANRIVNIAAAIFTIIYVIGGAGGYFPPHYIIIAAIEVVFLLMIIVYSLRWKE